jgi:hypothetical protein
MDFRLTTVVKFLLQGEDNETEFTFSASALFSIFKDGKEFSSVYNLNTNVFH